MRMLIGLVVGLVMLVAAAPVLAADPLEGDWSLAQGDNAHITQTAPGQFTAVNTTASPPAADCPLAVGAVLFQVTAMGNGAYSGFATFTNIPGCDTFQAPATVSEDAGGNAFLLDTLAQFTYTRIGIPANLIPALPFRTFIGPPEPLLRGSPEHVAAKLWDAIIGRDLNCLNAALGLCNENQRKDTVMWWIAGGLLTEGAGKLAAPLLEKLAVSLRGPLVQLLEKYGPLIERGTAGALGDLRAALTKSAILDYTHLPLPNKVEIPLDASRVLSVLKPGGEWVGTVDKKGILTVDSSKDLVKLFRELKIGTEPYIPKTPIDGQVRELPGGAKISLRNGVSETTVGPTVQIDKLPGVKVTKIKAADHPPPRG